MTTFRFVLAQHGTQVELVEGEFDNTDVGECFIRMPARKNEWWTVVKRFEGEDHKRVSAIVELMNFSNAVSLFSLNVLENHTTHEAFTPPSKVA